MDAPFIDSLLWFIGIGILLQYLSRRFPISIYTHQTIKRNDLLILPLFVFVFLGYGIWIAPLISGWFHHTLPLYDLHMFLENTSALTQLCMYLLLSDFLVYFTHRLAHSRYLWSTHALHHTPKHINWVTGMFGSPFHYLIILVPYTIAADLVITIGTVSFIYTIFVIEVIYQHFIHTNLRLPCSKYIEYVFVTPRVHLGHHHSASQHIQSNYGLMFTFWDRLFGTYSNPDTYTNNEQFGISYTPPKWALLTGLFAGKQHNR